MKKRLILDWQQRLKEIDSVDCVGDDFFIYENSSIHPVKFPFMVNMTICTICTSGEASGKIDSRSYTIQPSSISISLPGQILEHEYNTDDFSGVFILMSNKFSEELRTLGQMNVFLSVKTQPVVKLTSNQFDAVMNYCNMIRRTIRFQDNPNRLEIVKHLTIAFFYGLGYYFHKSISTTNVVNTHNEKLLQDFLMNVQRFHKKEHRVEFYAAQLRLNPQHLSRIIKASSGKSATDWIEYYIILTAKALLKSTTLTIQQISIELNFPSQSFFGKFFKRCTNVSPKEYREN